MIILTLTFFNFIFIFFFFNITNIIKFSVHLVVVEQLVFLAEYRLRLQHLLVVVERFFLRLLFLLLRASGEPRVNRSLRQQFFLQEKIKVFAISLSVSECICIPKTIQMILRISHSRSRCSWFHFIRITKRLVHHCHPHQHHPIILQRAPDRRCERSALLRPQSTRPERRIRGPFRQATTDGPLLG